MEPTSWAGIFPEPTETRIGNRMDSAEAPQTGALWASTLL
jgi:hypothetical protein